MVKPLLWECINKWECKSFVIWLVSINVYHFLKRIFKMGVDRKFDSRWNWKICWDLMPFQLEISSWKLVRLFFQVGLRTPLQTMWFSKGHTGIDAQILAPKKRKYTFLYTDIFFFRLFPQFKTKKNLVSSKKIYLS